MPKALLRFSLIGLVMLLLGGHILFAQGGDPVTLTVEALPANTVVGTGVSTVTLHLKGDSSACPVIKTNRPVDVVLLIDTSGSMDWDNKIDRAREAAIVFLNNMDLTTSPKQGGDQVAVVAFSDSATVLSELSQDRGALEQSIQSLTPEGGTSIAAGLYQATRTVNNPNFENVDGQATPIIVLLSDGKPDPYDPQGTLAAADQAKSSGARIVTIGLMGTDADPDLLRQIATVESDYYEAPSPDDLPRIYETVAHTIIPRMTATDIRLSFRYNRDLFELLPDSINPPAVVEGDTLRWSYGQMDNTDAPEFSFQVRALQLGTFPVGSIVDSSYLPCEQSIERRPLAAADPVITASLPTPTPSPTATATPLPTSTPSPTPLPTLPPTARDIGGSTGTKIQPSTRTQLALGTSLAFCKPGWNYFPWLLLLILGLLLLLWAWWMRNRPPEKRLKPLCFLARSALLGYFLFLLWLLALPFFLSACPKRDSIFFWRRDESTTLTGIYVAPLKGDAAASFSAINKNGCIGCHSVASKSDRIAAIRAPIPGQLVVYNLDGSRVRLPQPIPANYISLAPNGQRAVIAQPGGDLAIVDLKTGLVAPLNGANDPGRIETMPSWGPDGRIAFVVAAPEAVVANGITLERPTDIYTIPETGGQAEPLAGASGNGGFNYYPAYSPDGKWLAFTHHNNRTTYSDEAAEIWLVPAAGGAAGPIEANYDENGNPIPAASNSWPSWSRDSRTLAFNTKRKDLSFDVYYTQVNADGSTTAAHPLKGASEMGVFEHTPAWGPPPKLGDPLNQALKLWPWLFPLIPLLLLAWLLCRRPRRIAPVVVDTPEAIDRQAEPLPLNLPKLEVLWEPRPALILGFGQTGRWVLTHIKKNLLDANNGKMPKNIRLLCLDTGDYALLKKQDQKAAVTFAGVELSPEETLEIRGTIAPLLESDLGGKAEYAGWLNQTELMQMGNQTLSLNSGLGQSRPLARAAFLDQLQTESDNLWTRIQQLAPDCLESEGNAEGKTLRTIIIGDTHSHIGSAVLLDAAAIAYQVGKKLKVTGRSITAHLISRRDSTLDQVNTAASLREIMRFQLAESRPFYLNLGVAELDGLCSWRPLDNILLYDPSQQRSQQFELDIFPMVADAITMSLDKVTYQSQLRDLAQKEEAQLLRIERASYKVHVASEGVYQFRLPFADLIDYLRFTFVNEVVRRLLDGNDKSRPSVDERFTVTSPETPVHLAKAFLSGELRVDPAPAPLVAALNESLQPAFDQDRLAAALQQLSFSTLEQNLNSRLRNALGLFLNGAKSTKLISARAGKLRLALEFLEALPAQIAKSRSALETLSQPTSQASRNATHLAEALTNFEEKTVTTLHAQLQAQADALGLDTQATNTLYYRIGQRSANLIQRQQEMGRIRTRTYLWTENDKPLNDLWYNKYMFPKMEEALGQFFWQVNEDSIALMFVIDKNQQIVFDTQHVETLEEALYNLASAYCSSIQNPETLAALLRQGPLSRDELSKTERTLLTQSAVWLDYQPDEAPDHMISAMLAANANVSETQQISQHIRPELVDPDSLYAFPTTDPFVLGYKQRRAIVPLEITPPYTQTQDAYKLQFGLMTGPDAQQAQRSIFSAVYEAEAVAVGLEQRLPAELNTRPRMLHPLVAIGFTAPARVHVFCLALASGEIGIEGPLPGPQQRYEIRLLAQELEKEIAIPDRYWDGHLHPLVQAYLWFVRDVEAFNASLIQSIHERYRTDPYLPELWREWMHSGWREYLQNIDEFNTPILTDLLNVTRLWIRDFSRRTKR